MSPRAWPTIALLAAALLTAGCGATRVTVNDTFPRPLVETLPVHLGLYLDETFTDFRHDEDLDPHGKWSIRLGPGQTELFRHLLPAMFARVDEVSSLEAAGHVDAVMALAVEDFQFSVPRQNRGSFYEVWIRYQVKLYEPSGELIAEWPLTGYGKANERDHSMFSRRSRNVLNEAATIALRDAGAFMALQFMERPEIRSWLDGRTDRAGSPTVGGSF